MPLAKVELFGSLDCPYAYLATFRLRQIWSEYADRIEIVWRPLSLEYVNERAVTRPLIDAERDLFARIEPDLPYSPWSAPGWEWPTTMWPAFEALACAQAQNPQAALAMSWALRHGFYAQSRNIALRHVLLDVAQEVSRNAPLDAERFEQDWDGGRYKKSVIEDSRRGWHELGVEGSATFVLPDGRQVTNPGIGEIDFDEENYVLRSYEPYGADPLQAYRQLLDEALSLA